MVWIIIHNLTASPGWLVSGHWVVSGPQDAFVWSPISLASCESREIGWPQTQHTPKPSLLFLWKHAECTSIPRWREENSVVCHWYLGEDFPLELWCSLVGCLRCDATILSRRWSYRNAFAPSAQIALAHVSLDSQHQSGCMKRTTQPQIRWGKGSLQEGRHWPKQQHCHKTIIPQMRPLSPQGSNVRWTSQALTSLGLCWLNH